MQNVHCVCTGQAWVFSFYISMHVCTYICMCACTCMCTGATLLAFAYTLCLALLPECAPRRPLIRPTSDPTIARYVLPRPALASQTCKLMVLKACRNVLATVESMQSYQVSPGQACEHGYATCLCLPTCVCTLTTPMSICTANLR